MNMKLGVCYYTLTPDEAVSGLADDYPILKEVSESTLNCFQVSLRGFDCAPASSPLANDKLTVTLGFRPRIKEEAQLLRRRVQHHGDIVERS